MTGPHPLAFRDAHHVGVCVPDLDAARRWLVAVLGAVPVADWGPFADPDGDTVHALLDVDPRASVRGAFLRVGPTTNVELVEVAGTDGRDRFGGPQDVGTAHLAVFVDDLDTVLVRLRDDQRVAWVGRPAGMPDGHPLAGYRFAFARAPWGLLLELVSYPDAAEPRFTAAGMYTPPPATP